MSRISRLLGQIKEALNMSYTIEGSRVRFKDKYCHSNVDVRTGDEGTVTWTDSNSGTIHIKFDNGKTASVASCDKRQFELLPGPHYEEPNFNVYLSETRSGAYVGNKGFKYFDEAVKYIKEYIGKHNWIKAQLSDKNKKLRWYYTNVDGQIKIDKVLG
jgi:hypothetical protein